MSIDDLWRTELRSLDSSIQEVTTTLLVAPEAGPAYEVTPACATLTAVMHAATRGAWKATRLGIADLQARKRAIDELATREAEQTFERSSLSVSVVAGEGPGEQMPGAYQGQRLGTADESSQWDGAFDYVDGTTLTAKGLPGALSLGALGRGVRAVPDLQAYAVLGPTGNLAAVDILSPPEEHAIDVLRQMTKGKEWTKLRVLTHSSDTGPFHDSLIEILRVAGVGEVIVPEPVIIEPNFLLSLAGLGAERVDGMIGVFGFPELVFAAMLLDLLAPEYGFIFRPASIAALRRPAKVIEPLFEFADDELRLLHGLGWEPGRQYTSGDLVPRQAARHAAMFAVTPNDLLKLPGPRQEEGSLILTGLVVPAPGIVVRLDVRSM